MSDANQVALRYAQQSTWGAAASSGTYNVLRFVSEDLRQATDTIQSNELRSDRQVSDLLRTSFNVAGTISTEVIPGSPFQADFIEAALLTDDSINSEVSLWTSDSTTFNEATAVVSGYIENTGEFSTASVGDWVRVYNASNTTVEGMYRIVTVVSNDRINVTPSPPTVTTSCDAAIMDISYNGTSFSSSSSGVHSLNSFDIEREYVDLTNEFVLFRSCVVDTWTFNASVGEIMTHEFGMLGALADHETTTAASGTSTTDSGDVIVNTVDNIQSVIIGDYTQTATVLRRAQIVPGVTGLNFTLRNNFRALNEFGQGQSGVQSMGTGSCQVDGTVRMYFDDASAVSNIKQDYLEGNRSSLAVVIESSDDHVMVIDFPRIRWTSMTDSAPGINQDVFLEMGFSAYREPPVADGGLSENNTVGQMIGVHFYNA